MDSWTRSRSHCIEEKLGEGSFDPELESGALRDRNTRSNLQWVKTRPTRTVADDADPYSSLPINGSKHVYTTALEGDPTWFVTPLRFQITLFSSAGGLVVQRVTRGLDVESRG